MIVGAVVANLAGEDVAYVSLEDSDRGRVRGHFERIWVIDDVRGAEEDFASQCRARNAASRGRGGERQASAAAEPRPRGAPRPKAV